LRDLLDRSENLYRRIARLDDILFGARAIMAIEGRCSTAILDAWQAGRSSLRSS